MKSWHYLSTGLVRCNHRATLLNMLPYRFQAHTPLSVHISHSDESLTHSVDHPKRKLSPSLPFTQTTVSSGQQPTTQLPYCQNQFHGSTILGPQYFLNISLAAMKLNRSVFPFIQVAIFCKNTPQRCLAARTWYFKWFERPIPQYDFFLNHLSQTQSPNIKTLLNMNPTIGLSLESLRLEIGASSICYKCDKGSKLPLKIIKVRFETL